MKGLADRGILFVTGSGFCIYQFERTDFCILFSWWGADHIIFRYSMTYFDLTKIFNGFLSFLSHVGSKVTV